MKVGTSGQTGLVIAVNGSGTETTGRTCSDLDLTLTSGILDFQLCDALAVVAILQAPIERLDR